MPKSRFLSLLLICGSLSALSAQQYSLSPLAGGGPPLGPVPATDVWIDHVFGVVTDQKWRCIFQLSTELHLQAGSRRFVDKSRR